MAALRGFLLVRAMSRSVRDCFPKEPVLRSLEPRPPVKIPLETVHQLEKLSLVRFGETEALKRLEEAATFAQVPDSQSIIYRRSEFFLVDVHIRWPP